MSLSERGVFIDIRIIIGINLRHYRKERGMSQEALALTAGSYSGYISRIEDGQIDCKATTLERLAEVLDVTVSMLTDDSPF